MSTAVGPRPPPELEEKMKEYKLIESDLQTLFSQKQTILAQLNENTLVQGELGMIKTEEAKVYKLIGPVLVPVDFEDAKQNVAKRLEFIEGEVKKIEGLTDTKQEALSEMSKIIQQMQQKMAADATAEARAVAANVSSSL